MISFLKKMNMLSTNDGKNANTTNLLGFTLSSHMNMEQNQTEASSIHNNFFLSPHFNHQSLCYGVEEAQNGVYYPNYLSSMPLNSDGSLCFMDNFNRSEETAIVQSVDSPKLEDFLGSGPQDYNNNESNIYYNSQNQEHEEDRNQALDISYFQPIQEMVSLKNWEHGLNGEVGFGDMNTLSLSISPGIQSTCVNVANEVIGHVNVNEYLPMESTNRKRGVGKSGQKQPVHRKSIDTFGQRTSQYRGVTRHRWTGRYEAHLWDNSCKKEGQTRKGRQVYLGGYDMEEKAARSYDLAALKYWGPSTHINFPLDSYRSELEEMKNMSRQEYVAHLRRRSSGFSRGASMYRGVTRHHQHGRWQARIGRVSGNKDLYLGTFGTQEEAAEAYDVAAIKFRGLNAVTNFEISKYDTEKIMSSNSLLATEFVKRNKAIEASTEDEGAQLNRGPFVNNPYFHDANNAMQMVEHASNASSLVTSLSSSAEASPVSSWIPNVTYVPVFGGWGQ